MRRLIDGGALRPVRPIITWPMTRDRINSGENGAAVRPLALIANERDLQNVLLDLDRVIVECRRSEADYTARLPGLSHSNRASAANLLHYLSLRSSDLRQLQSALANRGLSSLGRNESHVLANLLSVQRAAAALATGSVAEAEVVGEAPHHADAGRALLQERSQQLLGPAPADRPVRIMVTLPRLAAQDPGLPESLLRAGMNCARINTAHDAPEDWVQMAAHVRAAARRLGVECRILMDLAGPKIRTREFEDGPEVMRIKPVRDELGRVVSAARLTLHSGTSAAAPSSLPVSDEILKHARAGDELRVVDARKRVRMLAVCERLGNGRLLVSCDRTVYFLSRMSIELLRDGQSVSAGTVGRLPPIALSAEVRVGDRLDLLLGPGRCSPAVGGGAPSPAALACTTPEVLTHVSCGEHIWFDDGRVGAVVRERRTDRLVLEVVSIAGERHRIAADKGMNLPESVVAVHALTESDRRVLSVVAQHADMVGLSFIASAEDYVTLRRELDACGGAHIHTVLKIETRQAFDNLPSLLLAALAERCAGLMIARGDLAVELGFERLAEVQEEILWLSEAAHIPVIWATQVLESLAKTGHVSRAEVTDAAMAERAECVMLNKGRYILDAVRFLDGVLRRMRAHQDKKSPMLRALNVARQFSGAHD